MKDGAGTLLLIILFVLVFKDFVPDTQTTVYEAYCADRTQSAAHCPAAAAGPRTVFRAILEAQTVVSLEGGEVARLRECTVLDAKNWACNEPGFSQSMSNGVYQAPWESMTVQRVSWAHWQALRALGWINDIPRLLRSYHLGAWAIGIITLLVASGVSVSLYRRLVRQFPWMGETDGGMRSDPRWWVSGLRTTISSFALLGLIALALGLIVFGIDLAQRIDR